MRSKRCWGRRLVWQCRARLARSIWKFGSASALPSRGLLRVSGLSMVRNGWPDATELLRPRARDVWMLNKAIVRLLAAERAMEDTKITANLPNLQIEIRRRDLPEEHAEAMTIHLRATPSFDVFANAMLPALSAFSMMSPMAIWMRTAELAWQPWLRAMGYPALAPGREQKD